MFSSNFRTKIYQHIMFLIRITCHFPPILSNFIASKHSIISDIKFLFMHFCHYYQLIFLKHVTYHVSTIMVVPTFIPCIYKRQSSSIVRLNPYFKKVEKKTIRRNLAIVNLQINFLEKNKSDIIRYMKCVWR